MQAATDKNKVHDERAGKEKRALRFFSISIFSSIFFLFVYIMLMRITHLFVVSFAVVVGLQCRLLSLLWIMQHAPI